MNIKTIEITKIEDFISYTNSYKNDNKIRLYRGQEDVWPLDSKLLRSVKKHKQIDNIYKIEQKMFNEFKTQFRRFKNNVENINDWDILSLAQHYGLPTRLLDWTKNPMIALWFAFENRKHNENDRIVWGLVVEKDFLADFKTDNPFQSRFIKVFQPQKIDRRIKNQESWFSIQSFEIFGKGGGGDGLPTFNHYNTINELEDFEYHLVKILFKNTLRTDIIFKLKQLGIDDMKIYPDLMGLCRQIEKNYFE